MAIPMSPTPPTTPTTPTTTTSPTTTTTPSAPNSTDATRGQPLADRARRRKAELEAALAALPADELSARADITLALTSVDAMLTGNSAHLPDATAAELNRWLEGAKRLAAPTATAPAMPADIVIRAKH